MIQILELLAVITIILTALAVMTGSLDPGDVFRRLGTALILLLIMPAVVVTLIRRAVLPLMADIVTVLVHAASILAVASVIVLALWVALQCLASRAGKQNHRKE